jgi:four helix bundle protein
MKTPLRKAKGFRDLPVWQKAADLVVSVYSTTRDLPRSEQFGLTSQIRRAAVSVPANIAEGWGRGGRRELHRFCTISRGSVYELDCLLELTERLGMLPKSAFRDAQSIGDEVGRMLSGLRTALNTRR